MATVPGWTGRVFEDFTVGDVYEHPLGRTVTQADNIWFTCLTMNTNPIHFDAEYSKKTEFKRPLVNSCFTLALVTGQSVIDLTMNAVANLGWDEVKLPHPCSKATPCTRRARCSRRASRSRGRRPDSCA
jgi:acyl dehydratase